MPDEQEIPLVEPGLASDPEGESLGTGVGLCLSGGGYRAMLFHLGTLWRFNDAAYLERLERISSVSGGSITTAVLGFKWARLRFVNGVATAFRQEVVEPVRALARTTIDRRAILTGILGPGTVAERVAKAYRKHLFGEATLQDLPDQPRFVINATNLQSGALWRFSKPYMWDYRVGRVDTPRVELAVAVGASSAFPPVLSPVRLRFQESDFAPGSGKDLQRPPFTTTVFLSDGGVYDNMGIETAWKRCATILVSDAGGKLASDGEPALDWPRHSIRVLGVIDNQVRSLRKRQVIEAFKSGQRKGAYWGIRTDIRDYHLADALPCPIEKTTALAEVETRLAELPEQTQERLINWGYAAADAALRRHVDTTIPKPGGFPYAGGVG